MAVPKLVPSRAARVSRPDHRGIDELVGAFVGHQKLRVPELDINGLARQDIGGLAMTTALDELYGLGYGFIDTEDAKYEAVSLEEVKAAAQKYLRPGALVVSIVKPDKS